MNSSVRWWLLGTCKYKLIVENNSQKENSVQMPEVMPCDDKPALREQPLHSLGVIHIPPHQRNAWSRFTEVTASVWVCVAKTWCQRWLIDERSDACVLANAFPVNLLRIFTEKKMGEECICSCACCGSYGILNQAPFLLCSTTWTVSCLNYLHISELQMSFSSTFLERLLSDLSQTGSKQKTHFLSPDGTRRR